MSLEIVYTDHAIGIPEIRAALSIIFPSLLIQHYDFSEDFPKTLNIEHPDHAFFNTSYDPEKLELGFSICLYGLNESDSGKRELYLGQQLSDLLQIRTLVPFQNPDKADNPYYDILFQEGRSFLVNDSDTSFADGTEHLISIIGEYPLPELQFDHKGNWLNG